jgi:hypothetical protein
MYNNTLNLTRTGIYMRNLLKISLSKLSPHTIKYLNILLTIIFSEFVWFAVSFYIDMRLDPLKAISLYSPMIEYLMMSLLITLGGGVIFDIAISKK